MTTFFFLLLVLASTSGYFTITSYNALQSLSQRVREKNSNMQVSVRKKLSLINQMIDLVKNYQEGEQFVQLKISQDNTEVALMNAYLQSSSVLTSMQGMAERFPNLKANEQYNNLSHSIAMCEHDVQQFSMGYNNAATAYNTMRLRIPTIFVARFMGFSAAPYLEFDASGVNNVTDLKEFKTDDGERLQQLLSGAGKQITGAGKSIANHAGQATKMIADKINDRKSS